MRYILTVFKGSYFVLLIPMLFGLSVLSALMGLDAAVYRFAQLQSEYLSALWSELPLHVGSAAPILAPLFMSLKDRNRSTLMLQSLIFTMLTVTILKALTSRVDPEGLHIIDAYSRSNSFEIGLFKNGLASVVEGWPSGHAATNVAMVITAVFGFSLRIRIAGALWAVWVVLATIFGDRGGVHWLSDSLSGAAIGAAIAYAHLSIYERQKKNIGNPVEPGKLTFKRSTTSTSCEGGVQ